MPIDPIESSGAASLPPLPNLSGGGSNTALGGQSHLAMIMSGVAPIKSAVDAIQMACKQIVQSGVIPGSEQVCGQIVALATSLIPLAVQASVQPGQGQQPQPGGGGGIPPVGM